MVMKAQEQSPSQLHKGNKTKEDKKKKGDLDVLMDNLGGNLYEVEAILSRRIYKGELQYLIKWLNYPESESTWEPYENVKCLSELLEEFDQKYTPVLHIHAEEHNSMEGEKLDENFLQVEAIRKKRKYKGQLQYLIKWRNCPEANNSWEPYDNIKHCTEILEAFEQSSREHKRKIQNVPPRGKFSIQIENDEDGPSTNSKGQENFPQSHLLSKERSASSGLACANFLNQKPENSQHKKEKDVMKNNNGKEKVMDDEAMWTNEMYIDLPKLQQGVEAMSKEESKNFVMQEYVREWRVKKEARGGVGAAAMSICLPNYKEDKAGQGKNPSKTLPKSIMPSFHSEPEPEASKDGNQLTDAKKRKLEPVRTYVPPDEVTKKAANINLEDSRDSVAVTAVSGNNTADTDNEIANKERHLTKILRPVQYYISTSSPSSDSKPHVYITFMALRSDGTEVCVNNKELRDINPLLLINFYEQHLRYTPDP